MQQRIEGKLGDGHAKPETHKKKLEETGLALSVVKDFFFERSGEVTDWEEDHTKIAEIIAEILIQKIREGGLMFSEKEIFDFIIESLVPRVLVIHKFFEKINSLQTGISEGKKLSLIYNTFKVVDFLEDQTKTPDKPIEQKVRENMWEVYKKIKEIGLPDEWIRELWEEYAEKINGSPKNDRLVVDDPLPISLQGFKVISFDDFLTSINETKEAEALVPSTVVNDFNSKAYGLEHENGLRDINRLFQSGFTKNFLMNGFRFDENIDLKNIFRELLRNETELLGEKDGEKLKESDRKWDNAKNYLVNEIERFLESKKDPLARGAGISGVSKVEFIAKTIFGVEISYKRIIGLKKIILDEVKELFEKPFVEKGSKIKDVLKQGGLSAEEKFLIFVGYLLENVLREHSEHEGYVKYKGFRIASLKIDDVVKLGITEDILNGPESGTDKKVKEWYEKLMGIYLNELVLLNTSKKEAIESFWKSGVVNQILGLKGSMNEKVLEILNTFSKDYVIVDVNNWNI